MKKSKVVKMTDHQRVVEMLTRAGVKFTDDLERNEIEVHGPENVRQQRKTLDSPNRGFSGSLTVFYFKPDGSLCAMGAWRE